MLKPKELQAIVGIFEGKSYAQVAKELGVVRETIYEWARNPEFAQELKNQSMNYLGSYLPDITANMIDLAMNSRSENVRFLASQDILDRVGMNQDETDKESTINIEAIFKEAKKQVDDDDAKPETK